MLGWADGLPAVNTAFYRYPFYHSPPDTAEKLAYPELAEVALGLFGAAGARGYVLKSSTAHVLHCALQLPQREVLRRALFAGSMGKGL